MSVLSYPIKNKTLIAPGSVCFQWFCRLVLVICFVLLGGGTVFSQSPVIVRTINPTGGLTGGDLKIDIYSDGSYTVMRNGKSETYGSTYSNPVQGINTMIRLNHTQLDVPLVLRFGIDSIPNTFYISPISGTGVSGDAWKVQVLGQMLDFDNKPLQVCYTINYEQGNSYFFLDYLLHFNSTTFFSSTADLYITEATVMGLDIPATAINQIDNSSCMKGFVAGPKTTIGMLRTPALSCTPTPSQTQRSHVFINKTSTTISTPQGTVPNIDFTTFHAGNANKRNLIYEAFGPGYLSGDMTGSGGEQGIAGHRALGIFTSSKKIKTARFLVGYGTTQTEFDNVSNIANPALETDVATPLTVQFEGGTASGAEGNNAHAIQGLNLKVVGAPMAGARLPAAQYVRIKLIPDGTITNPATEHIDFEYEDFLIPAGTYFNDNLIPVTSVKILGNTQLQYNRRMKFELASCNTLVKVGSVTQCTYEIVDDEDRRITIAPKHKDVHEGQDTLISVHLPTGIVPSMDIKVQLSVLPTSTIKANAYHLNLASADSTVTIKATNNDTAFKLRVPANKILERNKVLKLHAEATVYGQLVTADTTINIIDSTRLDPANTVIKIESTPDKFQEGTTPEVKLSLPTGITTAVPIPITLSTAGSTATVVEDYLAFPNTVTIDSATSAVAFNVDVRADNLVEKTEILKLDATAHDGLTAFTVVGKSIDIEDSNDPSLIAFQFNFSQNPLTPGGAGALVGISLPSPLKAGYDILVNMDKGKSSTVADGMHTAFPTGPFTILKNTSSVSIPGTIDAFNGDTQDRTLVFVASATDFKTDSAMLPIINVDWNNPANKVIALEIVSNPFMEGTQSDLKVSFVNTVAWTSDINIDLTRDAASTAMLSDDYTLAANTIKLPAGKRDTVYQNFVTAVSDRIFKTPKLLILKGSTLTSGGFSITNASRDIEDTTSLNAANKNISIATSSAEMIEGTAYDVTFSLPAGVTTAIPININVVPVTGSLFTTADYIISTPPVINNDNTVTVQITIKDDGVLTGPATRELKLTGTSTSIPGLVFGEATITVKDKDYVPNMAFDITVNPTSKEIVEGASTGAAITLTLPGGLKAGYAIPVTISKGFSSQAGDSRHTAVPGNYTIAKDAFSVTIPVIKANVDNILNNDASVVVVAAATGFKKDSVALLIKDATASVPANKALTLEVVSTPLKEGKKSDLKISFDNNVSATTDINILLSRNVGNSTANTPGDYTLAYTTVKLPAGKRDTVLTDFITATSDRVFKPTKTLQLDGTATGYTITAASCTIEDTTSLNAANKNISIATSSAEMIEGTTYDVTFSLPAGVTTAIPININVVPVTGSSFTTADYIISAPPVINNGNTVTVQITIKDDGVLTGPATRELKLTGTSTSLPGLVFGEATITVKDKDYVPNMAFDITVNPTNKEITEGASTGAAITLTLPGGLKAGYAIPVTISKGLSSQAGGSRHTAVPGNYTIAKDAFSVTIPVIKANVDNILNNDASVVVVAAATGFKKDSVALLIKDATASVPANKALTLEVVSSPLKEGQQSDLKISFNNNVSATTDINILLSRNVGNSTANTPGDYTLAYTTVKLPAGKRDTVLTDFITATSDRVFKPTKTLQLDGTATGYTITGASCTIEDTTSLNAANKNISIATSSAEMIEGTTYDVTFSLPAGVTTAIPINISVVPVTGSSFTTTDYIISTPPVINNGNTVTVQITIKDDGVLTGPATRELKLTGTSTSLPGLVFGEATITVKDKDYVPNMAFDITVNPTSKEIVEGASTGAAITLTLPGGLKAGYAIPVTISKGFSSQAGDSRHTAVPGSYTIAKDAFSVTIPVIKANADNILNNDASVVVVAAATGFKKDSVALLIKDATASVPANKALTLEVVSSPLKEGQQSDLKISFNNNVSATTDINILLSRNVGNSTANTPGDYTLAYTTVKLPAGKRDTVLTDFITATSDRVFKPTKTLQLDGTATGYTITAASCTIEDTTSLNAVNKNISIATSSAEMIEGTTYDVTFSLPAGVTTAIPININVVPVTGSSFTTTDYIISTPPVINNGNTVTVQITIKDDGVLTGPATRELKLTGTSTSLPGLVFGEAIITVKDKDYVPNMAFDITVNPTSKEIVEGASTGAAITLTLPGGLKAGYAIPVTISKGLSSQAGNSRHTAVPGSYTIAKDAFSVTIPVIKANVDNILNNDASVVVVAAATGFKKDSVALLIKDATASVPANKALTLEVVSTPLKEGQQSDLKISFNNNVSATTDINILLSRNVGNSTANTPGDYTLAYTTVKLPAGKRDTVLTDFITATSDRVFKPTKTLQLDGAATGYTITAASCTIEDTTSLNAANKNISIATSSAEMIEGTTYDVTFSLPAGVTTAIPININVVPVTGSPFTTADYIISTPPVINNGNTVTVQITIKDDGVLTGPATRELKLTGTSTSLPGLVFGEVTITVKDKDYVPNMAFDITVNPTSKEIVEGASTGAAITLTLPGGLKAGYAIPVTISKGLSSQAGNSRHTVVPGNYTIAKDAFSVTIPVIKANVDNILNNDASVVVVAAATGFKKDSVALLIKDATASVPANKALTLEVVSSPLKEGKKSDLKISFNNNVSATTDINILLSRNVGNSTANTPGDYTLAYTTVKLPAGKRDTVLTDFITATSDRVFKPTKTLQLDGTATGYTITAASCTIEDTTSLNAANKNISIATSSAEMIEGTAYDVTFSLPAGVTTAIPINISVVPVTGSSFTTTDYIISTPPVINNGNTVTVQITIKDDGVLTGPATRELKLTGTSTSLPGLVFGEATITVKDKDYVPNMAFDITVNPTSKEIVGGAATGATIKLSLPGGLKAGYDIPVVITKGISSGAANARHTIIPGTYIIEKNKQSVTLNEIKAIGNNVLGDDETLVVVASANNFKKDSVTLTIKGLTTGKVVLTGVTTGNSVLEGKSYKVRAALAGGMVANKPVHVKISSSILSVAKSDKYDIIPKEFDITPAAGYYEFEVKAKSNNILDGRQLLRLTGTVSNFSGTVLDSLDVYIDDATSKELGNLKLTMKIDSAILHSGSESKVTIAFENPLITSTEDIQIKIDRDASSTLDALGYELIPGNITLPAGKSDITFKLRIKPNNAPKDNEVLQLLATTVPATFTVGRPGVVTIPGPGAMNVLLEKTADAAEPATNGGFIVKLGANRVAPQDVKVTLLVNDLSGFANIIPLQTTVIIPAGKNSVAVPVTIVDNYIIEGDKTITVAVKAAQVTIQGKDYALKFNAQDAVNILVSDDEAGDAEEKVTQRKIKIVKKNDAQEPDIAGAFLVKFSDDRITSTKDVTVNYVISGTATAGIDYMALAGNMTIPAGKNEGIIQIVPIDDEVTEATETVQLKLDKATSTLSSVIWEFEMPAEAVLNIIDNPVDNNPPNVHVRSDMSPNGDGIGNDFLMIENIEKYPKNDVVVFNRWGGTVFKISGYDNKANVFKGRANTGISVGGDVPDGSYFYIVNIVDRSGKKHRFTGFIVLKR